MVQVMEKIKRQQQVKTVRLDFSGALTVKNAIDLKEVLLSTLDEEKAIIVNLEGVTEIDLSSLQLLCSAHRYALKKGKDLTLNDPKESLLSAGKTAGFSGREECRYDRNNGCLWRIQQ